MSAQEKDALIVFGLTKYKALRPRSWKYRPRQMLDGCPKLFRANGKTYRGGLCKTRIFADGDAAPRPVLKSVFEHAGAEWLLAHDLKADISDEAFNLSTFIPNKARFALLDARREETQGGLTGRHEGINREPKTVGLSRGFDTPGMDATDNGQFPLIRRSEDPLIGAARGQMQEAVRAAHAAWSKPTARLRMRDLFPDGWRPDARGIDERTGFNPDSEFGRVPKYHMADWSWKPDGRLPEQMVCWPVTADSEFRDLGVVIDCSGWAPRVPVPRAEWLAAHRLSKTEADERERPAVKVNRPLRLDGGSRRLRVSAMFGLMDADERTALCASWE